MNRFFAVMLLAFLGLVFTGCCEAQEAKNLKPFVRVVHPQCNGSGVVFAEDEDEYFILSAGHVATANEQICAKDEHGLSIDLFDEDEFVLRVPVIIVLSKFNDERSDDLAILRFNKKLLQGHRLSIVPIADEDTKIKSGDTFFTEGFPYGCWPVELQGKILFPFPNAYVFNPVVFPGQSGSAMMVKDKEGRLRVVGIIVSCRYHTINTKDKKPKFVYVGKKGQSLGNGRAISLKKIYKFIAESKIND